MFSNENLPQSCFKYYCKTCDYGTCKKSSYDDHNLSAKHKKGNQNWVSMKICPNSALTLYVKIAINNIRITRGYGDIAKNVV